MRLNKGIAISALTILVTGAAVAIAQVPPKPAVIQVVSNNAAATNRSRAVRKAATPGPVAAPATAVATPAMAPKPTEPVVLISRESYAYPGTGRRDPFVSLMNTEELRPLLGDLKLVGVALDPTGRNSVAVLRDITTKEQYRVKVGQQIGRMRVAAINAKSVVFGIEEFGYSRQESLAMNDSTKVRTQ